MIEYIRSNDRSVFAFHYTILVSGEMNVSGKNGSGNNKSVVHDG